MVKKLAIFFISLVALLVSGGMIMYSVRSIGPDIVTGIEGIDVKNAQVEPVGYTETGPDEISIRRILERNPHRDGPD
jgi:hypothetical protein